MGCSTTSSCTIKASEKDTGGLIWAGLHVSFFQRSILNCVFYAYYPLVFLFVFVFVLLCVCGIKIAWELYKCLMWEWIDFRFNIVLFSCLSKKHAFFLSGFLFLLIAVVPYRCSLFRWTSAWQKNIKCKYCFVFLVFSEVFDHLFTVFVQCNLFCSWLFPLPDRLFWRWLNFERWILHGLF